VFWLIWVGESANNETSGGKQSPILANEPTNESSEYYTINVYVVLCNSSERLININSLSLAPPLPTSSANAPKQQQFVLYSIVIRNKMQFSRFCDKNIDDVWCFLVQYRRFNRFIREKVYF